MLEQFNDFLVRFPVKEAGPEFKNGHPAVDLKSKESVRFCAILVGCIESSAHPVTLNRQRQEARDDINSPGT